MIPMYIDYLRGLMPTEQEAAMGITYEDGPNNCYDGNEKEDEQNILKIILEYDGLINHDKFLGWPISRKIGGSPMNFKVLGAAVKSESPNYISQEDGHPNKVGQELIAKSFLEKYEILNS